MKMQASKVLQKVKIRTPRPLAIPIVDDTVTGMGASPKVLSILPGLSQTTTTSWKMKYRVKEKIERGKKKRERGDI